MSDLVSEPSMLIERARAWAAADPDPVTQAELTQLIEKGDSSELAERMSGELEFGTAGLRGVVGAGSLRMNLAVVRRVTRALADYLLAHVPDARALPVVIGGDARLDSERFADEAARVLLAAGIPVKRFREPVPTPFVAYAVRAFAANAGIMITASHNPPEYNGYKLYAANGAQVIPPADHEIAARMARLGSASAIPLADLAGQELIDDAIWQRYLAEIRAQLPRVPADRSLSIVYTPLHGVGAKFVEQAFAEAGYGHFQTVASQRAPDGRFPTVHFPNPEEAGVLDEALTLAAKVSADLLLANDPDADRLAVAIPLPSGRWQTLNGNQIGLLLADFVLSHTDSPERALVVSSLVSSPMLEDIAAAYGARAERVLTGIKWVWTAALALEARGARYCFGYEEALGYAFGRSVRDKDGVSGALLFAELAASARARGHTVLDTLHALYRRYGLWVSAQHSVVLRGAAGAARIREAVHAALKSPPQSLAGYAVSAVHDWQTPEAGAPSWRGGALLVELRLGAAGRVFVRPSGTEPKLKIYVDLLAPLAKEDAVAPAEAEATAHARNVAHELVKHLELDALTA